MSSSTPLLRGRSAATALALCAVVAAGCASASSASPRPAPPAQASSASPAARLPPVTLSIVGTSDLHGRIDRLPVLAGCMANLRRARTSTGGVVLVDSGDMFQGTLESNLGEGEAVIRGYNALGYAAASIGNHEFDYGPAGPLSTARSASDNPRGALMARAQQATFPLLTANIVLTGSDTPLTLPRGGASTVVQSAGVRVGIIGVSTMETLRTTAVPNVRDLSMAPLAPAIEREAARLRKDEHVALIVVAAHAGGGCEKVDDPRDLSTCDDGELMQLAKALPEGTVDVMVGGHTHRAIAQEVHGVAVIESWAQGRGFGRVDVTIDPSTGRVLSRAIQPPHELCAGGAKTDAPCDPGVYEGAPVVPDATIAASMQEALAKAESERKRPLGVTVENLLGRQHKEESALGNLLADLMREARPGTDVALMNGGGIRADLQPGPLNYGAFYAVFPFDNRFAKVRLKAAVFKKLLAANATHGGGYLSISGLRAKLSCTPSGLQVELRRSNGKLVRDDEMLAVLTSDFLATGGDGSFGAAGVEPSAFELEDDPPIREALVEVLMHRGGELRAEALLPPGKPRIAVPGGRPVSCAGPSGR